MLLKLISTMNKSEKQSFSRLAQLQKPIPDYYKLFNFLNKLLQENGLKGSKIPSSVPKVGHLSRAKKQLKDQLLKVFRLRYSKLFISAQLDQQILDAELLKKRGLGLQSNHQYELTKEKAVQYECHYHQCRIIDIQLKLALNSRKKDVLNKILSLQEEKQRVLKSIQSIDYFEYARCRAMLYFRKDNDLRREKVAKEVEKLLRELLQAAPKAITFFAKVARFDTISILYQLKGDVKELLKYRGKLLTLWDEEVNQHFKNAFSSLYKLHVYNHLGILQRTKQFKEFERLAQKALFYKPRFLEEEVEAFQNIEFLKFSRLINDNNFEEARCHINEIEGPLNDYTQRMEQMTESRIISWMYNIAVFYFVTEDFMAAENWFFKIIYHTQSKEQRRDLIHLSFIFLLIIYFEKQNWERLDKLQESSKMYLKRRQAYFDFEKILLNKINRLSVTIENSREILEQLQLELNKKENIQNLRNGLEEILHWIESRLIGVDMVRLWEMKKEK